MKRRILTILLGIVVSASLLAACGKDKGSSSKVKEFTAFFDRPGIELTADNEIKKIIAEKIGAQCKETWLTGQTAEEAVGMYIASGEYPDFMNWSPQLQEAGAVVAIDPYLDKFPNLKAFWSETQWNSLRQEDGHIYSIPQFDNINIKAMDTYHSGEAFWIQTRVLKWDNYPVIESLDQLFDLLERYYEANPTMPDGTPVIPFDILCYDWYYFCLENPPQFLDGWPNNGRCIVDPKTYKVSDYNVTPTAKRYFQKLNEEYKKGIINPQFMTNDHDQFLANIASGRVLCMVEQRWDFQTAEDSIKAQKLEGCTYVPLGITIEPGMHEMYYAVNEALVLTGGLCITTSCKDVEGALKFVNDLLDPEIITLRSWGVEGVDYLVDENGLFYRTQEMRDKAVSSDYKASHFCPYSYFPNYTGMHPDGKNAINPSQQPSEFFASLSPEEQECLAAYGAKTFVEMLDYNEIDGYEEPWYPMWSYVNSLPADTPGGLVWNKMEETKKQWLPQVVIAEDFEKTWQEYLDAYYAVNPQVFFDEMQEAVYDRIEFIQGKRPVAK